jgi:hypothetical protein
MSVICSSVSADSKTLAKTSTLMSMPAVKLVVCQISNSLFWAAVTARVCRTTRASMRLVSATRSSAGTTAFRNPYGASSSTE